MNTGVSLDHTEHTKYLNKPNSIQPSETNQAKEVKSFSTFKRKSLIYTSN